ncbi:G-protein subunit alpha 3 [Tieghemostelium lacteum]|uniref:G-protein subunit alpha 3 n=1 Tax=Tieghemostelium lacteum TaxID=361077 RepID=A0A152A7W8_TIELA|nr:G-protein subunit alpha 3 [Tieghemostelium lacteum]|eukprot:KYR02333.1 G-protein subunit alpha 3 [Tieghemostelium lacteum]
MDTFTNIPIKPVIRAYLCKKGHVVKNWKLRLFVLKPGSNYMEYFVDETKESQHSPQGRIPLFGCKVFEYSHTKSSTVRDFCFIVETVESKQWIISASSKAQQSQWMEAIREAATIAEETDEVKLQKHKSIEKSLLSEVKSKNKTPVLKLLLLGTGESGKSTIVKQMKILHHKGFSLEEQEFYKQLIVRNILDGVALLVNVITDHQLELSQETKTATNNFIVWYQVYLSKRPPTIAIKFNNATLTSTPSSPVRSPSTTPPLTPKHSPSKDNFLEDKLSQIDINQQQKHTRTNSDQSGQLFNITDFIPSIISNYITTIWSDPFIQSEVLIKAQDYHINESTQYYLNEFKRISKPSYHPTSLDILKSRATTNGVVETDFKVNEVIFRIVDVAGQRGERKKWINFFDDVTAIIFVAAISEYDQKLVEDNCTNRLHESLNLFDQICNDQNFPKTSIILFLNKIDLFREKLKRSSIQTCFPDYRDDQSYEKSSNYIKNSFLSKKRNGGNNNDSISKHIYFHFTCATDTKSFETVFNSVQDIIISKTLEFYC